MKKIINTITNRFFLISLLILSEILFLSLVILSFGKYFTYFFIICEIVAFIEGIVICNRNLNSNYKITIVFFVLGLPFIGVILYLLFGKVYLSKKVIKNMNYIIQKTPKKSDFFNITLKTDENVDKISKFIQNTSHYWPCEHSKTFYLASGEIKFSELRSALETAQKFIFLEYFIVQNGEIWQQIEKILVEKVYQGVDVRLIYDDLGCMLKKEYSIKKKLQKKGIKVICFNPYLPRMNIFMNYRDHRKIAIIDGNIGIMGGINIADEYANKIKRFGHWHDAAIKIEGRAVWNMTIMFLQMWEMCSKVREDYNLYKPTIDCKTTDYVHVFGDNPLNSTPVTRNTYLNIINCAQKYVYITTPYLILDDELLTALKLASLSGIDVKIILPHIPDKKLIFYVSQSYYKELLHAKVKIYEYMPGFIHEKIILSDDKFALIGSTNLDYRSLYLHFEASCFIYNSKVIKDILNDLNLTLSESKKITFAETNFSFIKKAIIYFSKILAPLL